MKYLKFLIPLALLAAVFLFLLLPKGPSVTVGPMQEDIYTPAVTALQQAPTLAYTLTVEKTHGLDGQRFTQTQTRHLTYQTPVTHASACYATGTWQYGDHSAQITELYRDDTVYLHINQAGFWGNMTGEEFYRQLPPVQLLTPANYATVTQTETEQGITLDFTQPTAGEVWALPQGCEMENASGTAVLSPDGQLQKAVYILSYRQNGQSCYLKVTADHTAIQPAQIPEPNKAELVFLEDVYAPVVLEQSCGYLTQATQLHATLTESIFSEVDPIHYESQVTIHCSGEDLTVDTHVELTDSSRGGTVSSFTQSERFLQGVYTISQGDSPAQEDTAVTQQQMEQYRAQLLTGNILSPGYITAVSKSLQDGQLTYTFCAGEALAETVCHKSCETIYQNPAFLDNIAQGYTDYQVFFYLTLDQAGILPIASGLHFTSGHIIEGIPYLLNTGYQQQYRYEPEA